MPDINAGNVINTVDEHLIGDAFRFVLDMENSHGSWMVDANSGHKMLDFYSCFASNPLGFNHPKMTDDETIKQLIPSAVNNVTNSDLYTAQKAEFVKTFYEKAAPEYLKYMFLIAGGSLAVENALKTAFDWKVQKNRKRGDTFGRGTKIMHFKEAFHGRSGYTMSLTNTDPTKTDRFPKFDWPRIDNPKIKFPDEGENHEDLLKREKKALDQVKHAILAYGDDIAGCILEPIQGEGGDNHFRPEFMRELQTLCNENNILFILDEVQSGMGLTGRMWAFQHLGVEPDIICFGKKSQVCGILCGKRVEEVETHVFNTSSRINSTWGGNLIDMVRCKRYLEIIEEDNLVENAAKMGKLLLGKLLDLQNKYPELISNARGRGLMCAFDVQTPAKRSQLREKAYEDGMLILPCGEKSIRFRPILAVEETDILKGIEILETAIKDVI